MPLAWAQIPWFAGIALFALALVLAFLRIARRRYCAATTSPRPPSPERASQDEEIESELEGLGIRRDDSGWAGR